MPINFLKTILKYNISVKKIIKQFLPSSQPVSDGGLCMDFTDVPHSLRKGQEYL